MTKQEAFIRFYDALSEEEKRLGPEGLPDFVKYIRKERVHLPKSFMKWATDVAKKV